MIVKLIIRNICPEQENESIHYVEVTPTTTLYQALEQTECWIPDVSHYYKYSGKLYYNTTEIPFIISEGKLCYNIDYESIYLFDFLNTHKITDNSLTIVTGIPQSGGPGTILPPEFWEAAKSFFASIYPFIEQVYPTIGECFFAWVCEKIFDAIYLKIKLFFCKKKQSPLSVADLLESREMWNSKELALLLGCSPSMSKELLKMYGYKYDRTLQMYTPSDKTPELTSSLTKIEFYTL